MTHVEYVLVETVVCIILFEMYTYINCQTTHSLFLPVVWHSYWDRMRWGHRGKSETSRGIRRKPERSEVETSRTTNGKTLSDQTITFRATQPVL